MFDRSSFDRTLYDRSSNFDAIEATLRGSGTLKTGIITKVFIDSFILSGESRMQGELKMLQTLPIVLNGDGQFIVKDLNLQLKLKSTLSGSGNILSEIGVKIPLGKISMEGTSNLQDFGDGNISDQYIQDSNNQHLLDSLEDRIQGQRVTANKQGLYLRQIMGANLAGSGKITLPMTIQMFMKTLMFGKGDLSMSNKFKILTHLPISIQGRGDLTLKRIGALNTETFELENINLKPGQTLIIDTDESNVFLDNILDVDSVTSDSVFFQLQPGDNKIIFSTDKVSNLSVNVLWQNRWL